jgi:hypothetical protein|tara:strand:+ start:1241 stop:2326 length:1086 start_codon:yes stop_codon:yes gene_type:complete
MLGNVHPQDVSIEPFKVHKRFTFTNADSGSGVYALKAVSGSYHNFMTGSANSQSFGVYNELSKSMGKPKSTWWSMGTYYEIPIYYSINHLYYEKFSGNPKLPHMNEQPQPYLSWGQSNTNKQKRELHNQCSVISIPQDLFGERIKPGSVKILDDSKDITVDLRDDGDGNLYDFAFSSSYATHRSASFDPVVGVTAKGSGSVVGNVFYDTGMVVMTNTGSSYLNSFLSEGTDGFRIDYRATHTIYQHEYTIISPAGRFTNSKNLSVTLQRSGSITVKEGAKPHSLFPPGDNPNPAAGSGSFSSSYQATEFAESFTTHSQFAPYITQIGLYNDNNELLVVGKTSRPIKNDPEMDMSFTLRFDV